MGRLIEIIVWLFFATIAALIVLVVNLTIAEHRECEQVKNEHKELKR